MDSIESLLQNEVVLGYVAIVAVFALVYWIRSKPDAEKYAGLIYQAANFAEKAIPDTGASSVGLTKLDVFLKKFIYEYEKQFAVKTSDEVLKTATKKVEELVWKKIALREVNK